MPEISGTRTVHDAIFRRFRQDSANGSEEIERNYDAVRNKRGS